MKNQLARFVSGDDRLVVSLRRFQDGFKTAVRHHPASAKAREGCLSYFEPTEEDEAQASFDQKCSDATKQGWLDAPRRSRREPFTEMPKAPGVNGVEVADVVVKRRK